MEWPKAFAIVGCTLIFFAAVALKTTAQSRAEVEKYRAEQAMASAELMRLVAENARLSQLACALHDKGSEGQ